MEDIAPDYINKIAGYRAWYMFISPWNNKDRIPSITSLFKGTQWNPSEWGLATMESACFCAKFVRQDLRRAAYPTVLKKKIDRHEKISKNTTCGIYSFASNDQLKAKHWTKNYHGAREGDNRFYVPGIVSHWGDVIIGTKGTRSEYAQLEAVFAPDKLHIFDGNRQALQDIIDIVSWLRENNVPVINPEDSLLFMESRGLIDPLEMGEDLKNSDT